MVGLINFTSKTLLSILLFIIIFLVSGCGEDTKSSCSNNSNLSRNDAGYYGEDVYFGGHKILGIWRTGLNYQENNFFNIDGTMIYERGRIYRKVYPQYGVSEDGNVLNIIDENNNTEHYIYIKSNTNCFSVLKKSTQKEIQFCKYETLSFIDNSLRKNTELGFFGYATLFGYERIVGSWKYIPINGAYTEIFDFKEDGSGFKRVVTIYGGKEEHIPFHYGVSQDGKELDLQMADDSIEIYQLVSTFEGCYKMIHQDVEYKLCKP